MRRILLLFITVFSFLVSKAQLIESEAIIAHNLVSGNKGAIGLSSENLNNYIISSTYENIVSGYRMVYLQQSFRGIPVYNQMLVLAFKNGILISKAGAFLPGFEKFANVNSGKPVLTAESAVQAVISDRGLPATNRAATVIKKSAAGDFIEFTDMGVSRENITAQLIWTPIENSHDFHLAWQVYIIPKTTSDYWMVRVDAVNSKVIGIDNYTNYDHWGYPEIGKETGGHSEISVQSKANYNSIFYFNNSNMHTDAVTTATYRVIPFPAEAPSFPLGAHALRTDPWLAAPGNATSLKWNTGVGGVDYDYTRGNNVWAYQDTANNNTGTIAKSASSTSALPSLTFDFTPDYTVNPKQITPVQNQQFNITNLFYWNNIIHDVMYQYGFTETTGNFQDDNQGRGGLGNDYVKAEAQDGGGTNNANFSTPVDGTSGRMQMYLWSAGTSLVVNSPVSIAGTYTAIESAFSTNNLLQNVGPKTGQVVYYNDDPAGTTHYGCNPPANSVSGKIALIDRGFGGSVCTTSVSFTVKVKNAQNAGAIAVIVVSNIPGDPIVMGGTDNTITIPAVMISQNDGAIIAAQLANNVNVTMSVGVQPDGDVDNGIIVHEYGHGISNRLTGGSGNSSCLQNAEQMGEGWSDYYALMFTQDWATATVNTGFNSPRGIGTYVKFQTPTGAGIRTQRYCTDFSINNRVYSTNLSTSAHNRGEIWCATLWDMTWNIINQIGVINPNLYNLAGGGGNTIAMNLVTEGLRLQQCSPGFISGRNAILQADQNLYGGAYSCSIWEAFRRRGMGAGASEGSTFSINDQVPDYNLFTLSAVPSVTTTLESSNIMYTNTVTTNICSAITNYTLRDTLPANITYVSGGTYDALNRVVSFPVTQSAGSTNNYIFTVNVNNGSYFAPVTLFNETVAGPTIPAAWTTTTPSGTPWTVSTTISNSSPNSFYVDNLAAVGDQRLATTASYALPLNSYPELSFWHRYNTENGWDGGAVEISTDGGTIWTDLGAQMTLNGYNGGLGIASTNALSGRAAFTGLQNTFINTKINLTSYAGMSIMLRFRFGSDNNTSASTSPAGWWVDDIVLNYAAAVIMRTNLFNSGNVKEAFKDMVTLIIPPVNDDAPGAILLPVSGGCSGSPYTNAGATQSGSEPFTSCVGTAGYHTVWFKFVAPASGNVRISNDYTGGSMGEDSRLALFSATNVNDYTTFTILACDDDNGTTNTGTRSILYATGLTPGNTYYIQLDGKDNLTVTGSFCLTMDELTSTMISSAVGCVFGQPLAIVNNAYTGQLSVTYADGRLIALVKNASGGSGTSTYTNNLYVNMAAVRTEPVTGQKYLDRNFTISNSGVTSVDIQFFMLNSELIALQTADPGVSLANLQATRQTGSVCDNDFVAANGTNSSLSQTANYAGTGYSWIRVTSPGLSKFFIHRPTVRMPVKVWLQGAYSNVTPTFLNRHRNNTTAWVGALNAGTGGNALSQPYNTAPFNYSGTESVPAGYFKASANPTAPMDWVLLELRDAITPETVIARRAAFVRVDGRIVDLDSVSDVRFNNVPTGNYHMVIRHRNHIDIRTRNTSNLDGSLGGAAPALYDLTTDSSKVFRNNTISNLPTKEVSSGVWGMWGGNANGMTSTTGSATTIRASGGGTINDYLFLVNTTLGGNVSLILSNRYHPADMNMDGTIRASGGGAINDYLFLVNTVLGGNTALIITQHQ